MKPGFFSFIASLVAVGSCWAAATPAKAPWLRSRSELDFSYKMYENAARLEANIRTAGQFSPPSPDKLDALKSGLADLHARIDRLPRDAAGRARIVSDVAIAPGDPSFLLAAGPFGVHMSEDGGLTWTYNVTATGASFNAVRFGPAGEQHALLGANSIGVVETTDGAMSFGIRSPGMGSLNVVALAADPVDPHTLAIAFRGLNDGGVYTSADRGRTWSLQPLPPTRYNDVAFAPDGTLFALGAGPTSIAQEGVYRRGTDGVRRESL